MREVEVKFRITDKALVEQRLAEKGIKLGAAEEQHDTVYCIPGVQDNAPGSVWLRIRKEQGGRILFTLKKQHAGGLDSIEHETEISDETALKGIIQELGFSLYSELTKIRRKGKLGGIEICLDELLTLGTFLEAEKLVDIDASNETVTAELRELVLSLGAAADNEVFEGYDVLERRSRGL